METLGKRSTALDALQGMSLRGKSAIVTGATSGIGVETARALATAGADVTFAVRSTEAGERLKKQFEAELPTSAGHLQVAKLDLADLNSVRAFAKDSGDAPLDLLINNAGIMGPPLGFTAQGFESQTGTNHLGHFLLTALLRPRLEKSKAARVVNVASDAHRRGSGAGLLATLETDPKYSTRKYSAFAAYGDSKLANILFARALARRLPPNVQTYSLHPGVIATNLTRSFGPLKVLWSIFAPIFGKSVTQGAATSIYAATSAALDGKSGVYLADCAEMVPTSDGRDDALAEKVWALSERAVA